MPRETPNEYEKFYSQDPYEVLGLSRTASAKEIKNAKKKLLSKYHPDVNKDVMAMEISQRINQAVDTLTKPPGRTNGSANHSRQREAYTPPRQDRSGQQQRTETKREQPQEEFERGFFQNLHYGAKDFQQYVNQARANGISENIVNHLLNSERGQKIIREDFISKLKIYKDRSDEMLAYVKEWKAVGVETSQYFNLPEVSKFLADTAINIKIKIWGKDDPDEFMAFVQSWKKAGIDLNGVVNTPEAKSFLAGQALNIKIKIWGKDDPAQYIQFVEQWKKAGVDLSKVALSPEAKNFLQQQAFSIKIKILGKDDPSVFVKFATEWKKAGVDLFSMVNSREVQTFLEGEVKSKLKYNKEKAKPYVSAWMRAGWQPSQEIQNLIEKV